jgi:hypothetical protein
MATVWPSDIAKLAGASTSPACLTASQRIIDPPIGLVNGPQGAVPVSACAQPLPLGWRRVTPCRKGLPDRAVWLAVKRSLSPTPKYGYDMSNARVSAPLRLFVWMSGRRGAIE